METKPVHNCLNCAKSYKSLNTLNKHMLTCLGSKTTVNQTKTKSGSNKNKILKNSIQLTESNDAHSDAHSDVDSESDNDENSKQKTGNNYDVSMTF